MPFVLSLDEGTSSARAALYDHSGCRVAMETRPIPCQYPNPGWVEQDAEEIWRSQLDAAKAAIARAGADPAAIDSIGITNQRETTVVWDRDSGLPVGPAIVWQCRRTASRCAELARSSDAALIESRTGLVIDAYFSATKIAWILDRVPDARSRARAGHLLFGNIDTWLIWKLTEGRRHVTDVTNASRTMLMDLAAGEWDPDLLRIFDIPRAMLPEIVPSSGIVAEAAPSIFGAAIPIAGIAGDQQAALAGQACFRPGLAKNTYGTGCFALIHAGANPPHSANRLLGTRAASVGRQPAFAVEGSVFIAGAAVQWLRDQLGVIGTAAESEAIAQSIPGNGGVYFVPAFTGLGAPHWDGSARGLLCGMTRDTGRAHIVRATLESIAYQTRELIDAMEADAGAPLQELRVDGGAAANNFLMQFQADILGRPIVRPADIETTALGAAYLAGLATGFWSGPAELESFWRADRTFTPALPAAQRDELFDQWRTAVARARLR
jgi:glycerol kinase